MSAISNTGWWDNPAQETANQPPPPTPAAPIPQQEVAQQSSQQAHAGRGTFFNRMVASQQPTQAAASSAGALQAENLNTPLPPGVNRRVMPANGNGNGMRPFDVIFYQALSSDHKMRKAFSITTNPKIYTAGKEMVIRNDTIAARQAMDNGSFSKQWVPPSKR